MLSINQRQLKKKKIFSGFSKKSCIAVSVLSKSQNNVIAVHIHVRILSCDTAFKHH